MKIMRMMGGVLLLLALLSVASAGYEDYVIDWQILPGQAYENTDVLVFGYINVDDLGMIVPVDDFELRIMEGSTIKKTVKLTDSAMTYVNDYNDSDILAGGFFATKVDGLSAGTYSAIISLEGNDVDHQTFQVLEGESNFSVNLVALTTNNGPIMELDYTGELTPVNVELFLYGRKNFETPEQVDVGGVQKDVIFNVPEIDTFDLDDYVDDDEVFGFVVYGVTSNDNPSEPEIIVSRTGTKSIIYDVEAGLETADLKKGAVERLDLSLENNGSLLTDYVIELNGSLSAYANVTDLVSLMPGESVDLEVVVELPRTHVQRKGNLTLTIKADGVIVDALTYEMDLLDADPVHSLSVENVTFDDEFYFRGDHVKGNITLVNDGDYTETVTVEYYFEGESHVKTTDVTLNPGVSRSVPIFVSAGDESTLIVTAINDYLDYAESFEANIVAKDYSFSFYLDENNMISQDSLTEEVSLVIENTGNVENIFMITSDYLYYELTNRSVRLGSGAQAIVNATINIPQNEDELNVTFIVCSGKDDCLEDLLNVDIFRTGGGLSESDSVVNVTDLSLTGDTEEGVIFTFDVTNNKLIAKSYELEYETEGDITFDFYPDSEFTVQPGETVKVYMYATPSVNGDYDITYTITEEGAELASGSLELIASSGVEGLTGFAVAAGSVLGIAGLVVLVLFIYFYFIRQPPEGEDDFKPVEVKKADLTKPSVKNENNKYW